ncbi:MAG: DNA topoisomerase 3 [Eubacteriales bacterium]|nr:DNA topoisomerase 3 [Eubacteriales bacterium]
MRLVIAEKPSVAMSLAKVIGATKRNDGYVEGNGYLVSWCVGHLVGFCDAAEYDERYKHWRYDDLPIVPEAWKTKVLEATQKQFSILQKLMHRRDVTEVIAATDAGREGELIFRLVYEKAGCKKPVKRLWISSMEESSIREGFNNMKDGSYYDDLYKSALCRAQADWLVGINASRLFSVLYNRNLKVGRVQTPTLAMIVEQNQKVKGFQKEKYFETHLKTGELHAVSERFSSKEEADRLAKRCQGKTCQVITDEEKEKTVQPPLLYDLTTLQRDANRILGYTAQETLDYAQSLYEDGMITYPRTDSQYLNDEMALSEEEMIDLLQDFPEFAYLEDYEPDIQRTLNSPKVTDHHAIIPTGKISPSYLNSINEGKRNVLMLIEARVLMANAKPYIYQTHQCVLSCEKVAFYMTFQRVKQLGFKQIERKMYLYFGKKVPEDPGQAPELALQQEYGPVEAEVMEKYTRPPKQFTEDTLLQAMEHAGNAQIEDAEKKGMGTPATRAAIIEKLVNSGFITRDKKNLIPTADGDKLITIIPEVIRSPKLTADWEMKLNEIARGESDAEAFMKDIEAMMSELTKRYAGISEAETRDYFGSEGNRSYKRAYSGNKKYNYNRKKRKSE